MTNSNTSEQSISTIQHDFFSTTPEGGNLFSVCAGIPAVSALQMASCFLASAHEISIDVAEAEGSEASWSAIYILRMAKAVVDSVICSMENEVKQ